MEADDEPTGAHVIDLPQLPPAARTAKALETLADGYKTMWPVYVANLEAATARLGWQRQMAESLLQLVRSQIVEVDLGRVRIRLTLGTLALGGLVVVLLLALATKLDVDELLADLWSLAACAVAGS